MDAFALQSLAFSQTSPTLTQDSFLPYFTTPILQSLQTFGQAPVGVPIPGTNYLLGQQTNTFQAFMAQALLQPSQQLGSIWGALSGAFGGGLGGFGGGFGASSLSGAFAFSAPPPPVDNCHGGGGGYNYNYDQGYDQSYSESYAYPQQNNNNIAIAVNNPPPAAAVSYG